MTTNMYLPPALALVSDRDLVVAFDQYRTALMEMAGVDGTGTSERAALRDALTVVEREMEARGISGEPWWAVERPPVRRSIGAFPRVRTSSLRR